MPNAALLLPLENAHGPPRRHMSTIAWKNAGFLSMLAYLPTNTLRNRVGVSTVQVNVLANKVAVKFPSVAGLVTIG